MCLWLIVNHLLVMSNTTYEHIRSFFNIIRQSIGPRRAISFVESIVFLGLPPSEYLHVYTNRILYEQHIPRTSTKSIYKQHIQTDYTNRIYKQNIQSVYTNIIYKQHIHSEYANRKYKHNIETKCTHRTYKQHIQREYTNIIRKHNIYMYIYIWPRA